MLRGVYRSGWNASENPSDIQHMVGLFRYNFVCQRKIITARTTRMIDHRVNALRVAFLALSASHQARGLTP